MLESLLNCARSLRSAIAGRSKRAPLCLERLGLSAEETWPPDDLALLAEMDLESWGWSALVHVESCGSTQDLAAELAELGYPHGTVVVADAMARGRGRRGRRWLAPRGGLWLTALLRPSSCSSIQLVGLAAALSAAETAEAFAGERVLVRWPNDVYARGRKLAGILIEAEVEALSSTVLLGIGLNLNNELPSELIGKAITLREVAGFYVPRALFAAIMLAVLGCRLSSLEGGEITRATLERLDCLGEEVSIDVGGDVVRGRVVGLDELGRLLVERARGEVTALSAGEIVRLEPRRSSF
ncbi:MAG: biotin--[acetyl-CoA-carboxylase] ligase [Fervidicoccaceae archaeon]